MDDATEGVLAEIGAAAGAVDPAARETACRMIAEAGAVAVMACGREMLAMKGLAMRLHHLGLRVGVAGEMTAPPIAHGDLLVACSGPGGLGTVLAVMRRVKDDGGRVLLVTAETGTPEAAFADHVLVMPARTMASNEAAPGLLPMGSAFEGALFVLAEVMVLRLREMLGADFVAMKARHTNME